GAGVVGAFRGGEGLAADRREWGGALGSPAAAARSAGVRWWRGRVGVVAGGGDGGADRRGACSIFGALLPVLGAAGTSAGLPAGLREPVGGSGDGGVPDARAGASDARSFCRGR